MIRDIWTLFGTEKEKKEGKKLKKKKINDRLIKDRIIKLEILGHFLKNKKKRFL